MLNIENKRSCSKKLLKCLVFFSELATKMEVELDAAVPVESWDFIVNLFEDLVLTAMRVQ